MDTQELRMIFAMLRASQRDAIKRGDWDYYWLIQRDKMYLCREHLSRDPFFSNR